MKETQMDQTSDKAKAFMEGRDLKGFALYYMFADAETGDKEFEILGWIRKDIVKDITYSESKKLADEFGESKCHTFIFLPYGLSPEHDKDVETFENGPLYKQVEKMEKEQEHHSIDEESWGDYTSHGPWELNGEKYNFVTEYIGEGDGEWHNVIVKRQSDGKFFEFSWGYNGGNYHYEDYLDETTVEEIENNISGKELKRITAQGLI